MEKKINLKRLFQDDIETLSTLLKQVADSLSFDGKIGLYDNKNNLIASSGLADSSSALGGDSFENLENDYYETSSGVIFKLTYEETLIGFIFIEKPKTTKEKIFILHHLVENVLFEIIKVKLEKKELLQEVLNNYREINLLYKFGGTISSKLDLDYVLKSVLLESRNIIEANTYEILLLNKETGELQSKTFLGNICPTATQTHPDKVLAHLVIKTGHSEIANDIRQKQKIKDCQCNINSVMAVPLKIQDELYGAIILTSDKENHFKARDEKLLSSLANQASIAMENVYLELSNWEHKRQLAIRKLISLEKEKEYKKLVGSSYQMVQMRDKIPPDPLPYLIYGEHGTGKTLLAHTIHRESQRENNPMLPVDCTLLSSNPMGYKLLFGSEELYKPKKSEADFSYIELAKGGTLLLQNIDMLSSELGEKLSEFLTSGEGSVPAPKFDVRIVAETSVPLEKKVEKGDFDPTLYKILSEHIVSIPPLRERKKDIISLIEYFLKEQSIYLGKNIKGIDDDAQKKLLSYNYILGNVKELKEILERACILTESDIITSEYLFLGIPAQPSKFSYNLFNIKPIYNLVRKGWFPQPFVYLASLFVLLIYYFAFIPKSKIGPNMGTFLAWALWWPFFIFSFFFLARLWCGICPINEYGIFLRKIKHFNLKPPALIKDNTHYFITIGFLLVIWSEEVFIMRNSGFRTGIIMAIIFSIAALTNILFSRHTYCRYVCPLGWAAGIFSFTSILELRSNPDICANKCKTHDCFKGNEKIEGCPMFLHTQFVNDNLLCKLCLRCVQLCPNNSPQLNLRLPGWDIATSGHLGQKASLLICCLLSVPFSVVLLESKIFSTYYSAFNFSFIYWTLPILFGFIIWLMNFPLYGSDKKNGFQHFYDTLNFYVPLALGANVAHQLEYIPILSKLNVTGILSFSLLHFSQGCIVIISLFFSIFLMFTYFTRRKQKQPISYFINHQVLMLIYSLLFLKLASS